MTTTKYLIFGICFLILAFFLLNFYDPKPPLLSITKHSELNTPYLFEGFVKGILTVQEITLTKEYLNGVEIRLATMSRVNTNTNTILVLDSNYNVLHQEKFSSEVIEDSKYHAFQFKESMKAGKGNKIYICLFSKDGDSANCIHGLFNPSSKLGSLYASMLINDDVIHSIRNKARLYPGTMILRTYESDSSFTSSIKWIWYLVVALLSVLIIFFKRFQRFLIRSTFRAEIVYFVIALIFGPLFVFLNPPFQVPDEGSHMSRIYELSELQFSKTGKTIPASIVKIDSTFLRLHFIPDEKTSKKEILSLTKIKLEPKVRRASNGPDYICPYLPQVIGVVIGKIFTSTALALLYFGRFFNLLFAILIVFIAIRITPFSKWIFLLLALMPKTLYMMASLSYDAFVISNSFLLIALFLYYAFKAAKLNWRDIGLLFFLSLLLAFCKPPYFIIGFLFLIIPVRKIGSWLKYLLIFSVFVVSMLLAQGMWSLVGGLIKSPDVVKTERVAPVGQPAKIVSDVAPASPAPTPPKQEINPPRQVDYIRTHLPTFMTLLMVTNFDRMRVNMLNNFVGTMG